jgi:deoxyguanosine kinase
MKQMVLVSIEGSIGVGKSTVLHELEKRGHVVQGESVEHWTLLQKMYENPMQYGALFQIQVITSFANQKKNLQFQERSAIVSRGVFTEMMHKDGYISKQQVETIDQVLHWIPTPQPQLHIYLKADHKLCQRRIAWRGRDGEEAVHLDYLHKLEDAYMTFLPSVNHKIIVVEEEHTPEQIADKILEYVHQMEQC